MYYADTDFFLFIYFSLLQWIDLIDMLNYYFDVHII